MVYTRRPATQNQANTTAPAYSTMSTRNSPQTGTFPAQQQYAGSVTTATGNYQQSYNTGNYNTQQTFPAKQAAPVTPAAQPQAQAPVQNIKDENNTPMETGQEGEEGGKKGFFRQRFGGIKYKPNKRVKNMKRNNVLRRVIKPKNSIMCLHEIITGLQFNVNELPMGHDGLQRFNVSVNAYGKTYEGNGHSKLQAKQVACENALKGILIDRMVKQAQKEASGDVEMTDENGDSKENPDEVIPWVNVASFALHKLFSEWQAQGTNIPLDGIPSNATAGTPKPAKQPKQEINRPLPENPTSYQPVMLLHMIRPAVTFDDVTNPAQGGAPSFTATCVMDGKTYSGTGSKKKTARKNAAKAALASLGVIYPPEA
nr:PREDICTED: double-stranded RNA-specific editase B2 [Bemisia tabaci]